MKSAITNSVESAKGIVVGSLITFESIKQKQEETGATLHSVDAVAAGKRIVEEA